VNINGPGGNGADREPPEIDTSVAHVARVYDYLLGGTANFKVDREAAERAYAAWPGGLDGVRADARAHRALLGRVVRYLVREAGIRQFLDIGTGIPKENNVHEVAQLEAPESRVVYADKDPIVLAHAHRLLRGTPEGATRYISGELREPAAILEAAAVTLDFGQPVAVLLFGVLHFFSPAGAWKLPGPVPPGRRRLRRRAGRDVHAAEPADGRLGGAADAEGCHRAVRHAGDGRARRGAAPALVPGAGRAAARAAADVVRGRPQVGGPVLTAVSGRPGREDLMGEPGAGTGDAGLASVIGGALEHLGVTDAVTLAEAAVLHLDHPRWAVWRPVDGSGWAAVRPAGLRPPGPGVPMLWVRADTAAELGGRMSRADAGLSPSG
jgi:hypothetical protein